MKVFSACTLGVSLMTAAFLTGCGAPEVDCNNWRSLNEEERIRCIPAPKMSKESNFKPTPNPTNWLEVYGTPPKSKDEKK